MFLTFKHDRRGNLRPYWYGVFQRGHKIKVIQCGRIAGTPPVSGKASDYGDAAFEQSRQRALAVLSEAADQHQSEADQEKLVQKIHELRYGVKVKTTPLSEIASRWEGLPRKNKLSAKHIDKCRAIFKRFVHFMAEYAPNAQDLGAVTGDQVRAFMEAEDGRGISNGTWNETLIMLKGIFRQLEPYADAWRSYLEKQPTKDRNVVHREPFTVEEITAIVDAADAVPEIKPLIITALCTAMRKGDVCQLRWRDVDLKHGFITVKTSKTGSTVDIPIFPMLRIELEKARSGRDMKLGDFVFPAAASLYRTNPYGLNWRLQSVLERAGFIDPVKLDRIKGQQAKQAKLVSLSPNALLRRGMAIIEIKKMTACRRERMKQIFTRYLRGDSVKKIAAELPTGVGTVSLHLGELERMTGAAIVRRPEIPSVIRGSTLAEKIEGISRKNRATLKGWHSFRTTWITLALSAGVPMELVCRVTGHAAADVVLKHYFHPGREQFRMALQSAMPQLLLNGEEDRQAEAVRILRSSSDTTWRKDRDRALKLLTT